MAFCTQCGKELSAGLQFCPECGAAVAAGQQPAVEPASQVDPVGAQPPASSAEDTQAGQRASGPSIAAAVKDVVDAVEAAIPELPSTGGVVEVLASAEVGKVTLSTWKSVPPVAQAIGAAVGQVQKAVQENQPTPEARPEQPAQPLQAAQEMPAQAQPKATQLAPMTQTEQFKSHRPTGRYASSGGGSRPAAEKKKSKLPLILIAAGALALAAVFALYVVPRFVFHPVDPNEHTALVSNSSASASASAGSSGASSGAAVSGSAASTSATSASSAAASASATSASASASSAAASASSEAAPPAASTSTSYSTSERPKIGEFKWMTGETDKGNAPAGAARITDFGKLTGGWKAYMYGGNLERLLNVTIDAGQSGAQVTLDWYYIRDNKQDKAFEDTTASSTFTGTFDGGMLDAMGSGRITLTAFWEQDGHQYATGSFMWPSGETEVIALVRP